MAVTIIKQPFYFVPAHNDIEFYASSDEIAQPNFNYYVTVTVNADPPYNYRIAPDPSDNCYYNALNLARKYVDNYYPFGTTGFNAVVNGTVTVIVNIGEEYGSTPVIYPGSDIEVLAWNSALTRKERSVYDPADYYSSTAGGIKWYNNLNTSINIKSFQDLVFYMTQFDFVIDHVLLNTYNSAGALLNEYSIANALNSFPVYFCVNFGPEAINQWIGDDPGIFTDLGVATLPVIGTTCVRYTITFCNLSESVQRTFTVNIQEPCENKFIDYSLYYLNRFGAFDFTPMQGNHKKVMNIEKTFYKGIPGNFEASHVVTAGPTATNGPSPLSLNKKALNISYDRTLVLQSQPYNQTQLNNMEDLMSSPKVFINEDFFEYALYSEEDTSYETKNDMLEKIVTVTATLRGNEERRQFE